ncbi:hypothetical protein [Petrocella sp. FN5]|uniref:hypothetical protein n=1 Tax=Petrocella sp. FN5 TaxID=3032002 RepID=UPI0023DCDE8A|nr:hypothetical protein [Petrocella sp. FN5]MDF1617563.1 hypothetical protein [Petrocella sp. FN5]
MKKILSMILVLALTVAMGFGLPVLAEAGIQTGDSLKIVNPAGGPYVIVTNVENSLLEFNYGWNNADKLEFEPLGYYVGVYNLTKSHYEWVDEVVFTEAASKIMKLSQSTALIPGDEYVINFFVRDHYADPNDIYDETTNGAILQVYFIAP